MSSNFLQIRDESQVPTGRIMAPALKEMLEKIGPCPTEALILGMCADGLPVCYNLDDGGRPFFIHAPQGWGKTHFLKFLLQAEKLLDTGSRRREICPLIFTTRINDWSGLTNSVSVQSITDETVDIAMRATSHITEHANRYQYVFILIDEWEGVSDVLRTRFLKTAFTNRKVCMFITSREDDHTLNDVTAIRIWRGSRPGQFEIREHLSSVVQFWVPSL